MVMQLKKKPLTVEGVLFDGKNHEEVKTFCGEACDFDHNYHPVIATKEGDMTASPGDYVIKGSIGEFYPVKPEAFKESYEVPDIGTMEPALEKHWNKAEREAAPASDWAVPSKQKLRISDERHTRLAWDMVERVKGLSDEEKASARKRILAKAHKLGIDTSSWDGREAIAKEGIEAEGLLLDQETGATYFTVADAHAAYFTVADAHAAAVDGVPAPVGVMSCLFTHLAEECSEIVWAACKVQRYGLDSVCPQTGLSNRAKLISEIAQAHAVFSLLNEELSSRGIAPIVMSDADFQQALQARIVTLQHEFALGRYTLPSGSADE